jgi:two-component system, OmpR family, KDP operon response regulator KdpE
MKQVRVLIVDDEERILNFLVSKLKASGYDVLTASNGVEALEQAQGQEPDLVVLDVLMPKMDGFETLKRLRTFSTVPVIILSARGTDTDRIKGLALGADDYLPKPFNPDELVARLEALKRRISPSDLHKTNDEFVLNGLRINFDKHLAFLKGEELHLTRIEWLLLSELSRNAGHLMSYSELLSHLWGPEYRDDVQILRTWISRLRFKIEEDPNDPKVIRTISKTGYIIDKPPD